MFSIFPTFRQKLVASYLLFVLIMILVAIQVFWFYNQLSNYQTLDAEYKRISMLNLEMYKQEKLFIQQELTNQTFYSTGSSAYINELQRAVNQNIELINALKKDSKIENIPVVDDLEKLSIMLKKYKNLIDYTIGLVLNRGFKDYGLEGSMRKKIHAIEHHYPEFDKAYMLMIRRNEKDYFLRNQDIYVQNVNQYVRQALLKEYSHNTVRDEKIKQLLTEYVADFNKIVALENQIKIGWQDIHRFYFDNIEASVAGIIQKSANELQNKMETLTTWFVTTFLISVFLSVWLAYFMSKAFISPINKIYGTVESLWMAIDENVSPQKFGKEKDEMSRLAHLFMGLLRSIQQKMQVIEANNQSLTEHNQHLTALNNDLKQANTLLLEKENHIEKMNSVKDKFLTILSHDLRSPLTTLKGFLTVLTNNPNALSPAEQKETIAKIQKSLTLQLDLLSNLLEWSSARLNEVKFAPEHISIGVLVDYNIELYQEKISEKNLRVVNQLEDNYTVYADKNMVDFILRNLLSNAIKFSYKGGQITVAANTTGKYLEINIIDRGVGIDKKKLAALLTPGTHFSTLGTLQEKGTGFGLLLCKEFAEKHGGHIKITPNEIEGVTATVSLRISPPDVHKKTGTTSPRKNNRPLPVFSETKSGVY